MQISACCEIITYNFNLMAFSTQKKKEEKRKHACVCSLNFTLAKISALGMKY